MNTMTHENKLYHTRRGNERARGPDNRGSTGAQSRARGARAQTNGRKCAETKECEGLNALNNLKP